MSSSRTVSLLTPISESPRENPTVAKSGREDAFRQVVKLLVLIVLADAVILGADFLIAIHLDLSSLWAALKATSVRERISTLLFAEGAVLCGLGALMASGVAETGR